MQQHDEHEEHEYGAPPQVTPTSVDDYLEVMSRSVFQSGMSWRVVNAKWPQIREAFGGFKTRDVAALDERAIDALTQDTRVIRNRKKLEAIVSNAGRLLELEAEHGGFANYLRSRGDFDETVKALRKDFKFMGDSGSYIFLYVVGEPVPPHDEWSATHQAPARTPRGSRRGGSE